MRIEAAERKEAEEGEADRDRKQERARRVTESGLKPLGRGSIPGALNDVPTVCPGISNSLRHVRSSSSTRLPCSMHMPLQFVVFR